MLVVVSKNVSLLILSIMVLVIKDTYTVIYLKYRLSLRQESMPLLKYVEIEVMYLT